jgi:hypothetical protein
VIKKRLHAIDAGRRFERDVRRWRKVNRPTLTITTVTERAAAAAAAAKPRCDGCGKLGAPTRPLSRGLCASCRAALHCLGHQYPGADHAALIVELRAQREAFARA